MRDIFDALNDTMEDGLPYDEEETQEEYYGITNAPSHVLNVPTDDREIYELLDERYDFRILDEEALPEAYGFTSDLPYYIFADTISGDTYGFIGGKGGFECDEYPIGFVSRSGYSGKIANSLDEFFTLLIFCPYWQSLLNEDPDEILDIAKKREQELIGNIQGYEEIRDYLAEAFGVTDNGYIVHTLIDCIMDEPPFIVSQVGKRSKRTYKRLGF